MNTNNNGKRTRRSLLKSAALGIGTLPFAKVDAMVNALTEMRLAEAFKNDFLVGVAMNTSILEENVQHKLDLISSQFSSITNENLLKWERIKPDGNWFWENADKYVDFGETNNMYTVGHTLVWHAQIPRSEFFDANQNKLGRDALLNKMHGHISTLVGRYRGRIQAWDVINEAVDNGTFRSSYWHDIIGADFMQQAFHMAHDADPQATLLYNDFNMHMPDKREFLVPLLEEYLVQGVPVHGVGFQGHIGLDYPSLVELEKSIEAYSALGLEVHITEMDVDVLPNPYASNAEISNRFAYSPEKDPYKDGLPDKINDQLSQRYEELFELFIKHRSTIKRVTLWGLSDALSWKNDFPIQGRTNHALLFDRELAPKDAYFRLLELANK